MKLGSRFRSGVDSGRRNQSMKTQPGSVLKNALRLPQKNKTREDDDVKDFWIGKKCCAREREGEKSLRDDKKKRVWRNVTGGSSFAIRVILRKPGKRTFRGKRTENSAQTKFSSPTGRYGSLKKTLNSKREKTGS